MRVCSVCRKPVPPGMPVCPRDGEPVEDTSGGSSVVGEMIGEYLVKGVVGQGGMGEVYEGVQPVIGKRVAIKLLKREIASDPTEAQRLLGEARSVNAIGHRGIIDIFSFGALPDGRQYFVMEYLSGVPLSRHIRDYAPLPPEDTLRLLDEMLAALGAAHAKGVIHRDIKASNIFLVAQPDGSSFVKVLDFGIAKQAPMARGETPQTRVSRVMGTPEFMAPEQARGEAVSPRTDIYALGVLTFQMLTGELPFNAGNPFEIVNMHLNKTPPLPSEVAAGVPEELDRLVLWMLEKSPARRPQTCEDLREHLKTLRRELNFNATRLMLKPETLTQIGLAPVADDEDVESVDDVPAPLHERETRAAPLSETEADLPPVPQTRELDVSGVTTAPRRMPALQTPRPGSAQRSAVSGQPEEPHEGPPSVTLPGAGPRSLMPLAVGVGVALVVGVALLAWQPWQQRGAEDDGPGGLVVAASTGPPPGAPVKPGLPPTGPKVEAPAPKVEPPPPVETEPDEPAPPPEPAVPDEPEEKPAAAVAPPTVTERPPTRPDLKTPKADPLKSRYRRVQSAWTRARAKRAPEDRRIFDEMLSLVGKQLSGGDRAGATEGLDDFVSGALNGREP